MLGMAPHDIHKEGEIEECASRKTHGYWCYCYELDWSFGTLPARI
jgi:hypothetical protein